MADADYELAKGFALIQRLAILLAFIVGAEVAGSGQSGQFKSGVTQVLVPVSVSRGGKPVTGLRPRDFRLFDDGVPRDVDSVSGEAFPLDVTLVLDTSGSSRTELQVIENNVRAMAALLRPSDQIRVVTFSDSVRENVRMRPARELQPFRLESGGNTALSDALLYALLRPPSLGRVNLIVLFSDGDDTGSVLESDAAPMAASRADALLFAAVVPSKMRPLTSRPTVRQAVEATGGVVYGLRDSLKAFRQILGDFHRSYVLSFEPAVPTKLGWHRLKIGVAEHKSNDLTVRAKAGYFAR